MPNKNISQVTKDIQAIQNIAIEEAESGQLLKFYLKPLLHSGLGKILKGVKSKGFNPLLIIQFLSLLPLFGVATIGGLYAGDYSEWMIAQKDVFYRLKNNQYIPWRKLVLSISKRFLSICAKRKKQGDVIEAEKDAGPRCFIFDDSDIEKTGKVIEGISKIWSHRFHRYILGFKLLVIAYYDGKSFIPMDFSLHREQNKKKHKENGKQFGLKPTEVKKQYRKDRTENSAGAERKKELDKSKIAIVLEMIKRACSSGFKAQYVLCDSWFFCFDLLQLVIAKSMHLVSGMKLGKIGVSYNGKNYSVKALVKIVERKAKYSRKLKIHYIPLVVIYKDIKIKLFFIRYGNQKKWRIIINSDYKKSFIQTIKIYQIRWSIEVFFKEMKQYLNLNKCQSRDFDAHIAHISLAMILYIALSLKKRVDKLQTIGELFRAAKNQIIENMLHKKIWGIFQQLICKLTKWFDFNPKFIFREIACSTDNELIKILKI